VLVQMHGESNQVHFLVNTRLKCLSHRS
jgi:hypothetical protein